MTDTNEPPIDVTEPLRELVDGLNFSLNDPFSGVIGEREQIAAALAVVARFLQKIDPDLTHASRFFDLGQIFSDLNEGARHPLIAPVSKRARPLTSEIQAAKAEIAFAADALIRLGETPEGAARMILKERPEIENLAGQKSRNSNSEAALRRTILEWRRTLRSNRRKNDLAAEFFTAGQELTDSLLKAGRREELRKTAMGRVRHAATVAKRVCIP